ncbi:MAG TPA: cytochrome c oxidase subunit II [Acidimicrobiales bacterium]|nr:cytochrome c oxidase subunit II [Acidimicrobiales bacterium]
MSTPRSSRSHTVRVAIGVAVAVIASAALYLWAEGGKTFPQDALDPQGAVARTEDHLWRIVFPITIIVFLLVNALILTIVIKFRRRSDDDAPVQVHGNSKLEIGWTIVPALLLAIVGVFTVATIFKINERASAKDNALFVKVIGHQWWWEFQYPNEKITTANELVIPTGRTVQLEMTSIDVIHSFWPPKLAGKVDVVPGRQNYMQLKADKVDTYWGQCAEFCGLSHANMRLRVISKTPGDFDTWVSQQEQPAAAPTTDAAKAGALLVQQRGCAGCHTINGLEGMNGTVGPNLTHLQSRSVFAGAIFDLNEQNLRRWLKNPPAEKPMMPAQGMGMPNLNLADQDITNIIAYLETLK